MIMQLKPNDENNVSIMDEPNATLKFARPVVYFIQFGYQIMVFVINGSKGMGKCTLDKMSVKECVIPGTLRMGKCKLCCTTIKYDRNSLLLSMDIV